MFNISICLSNSVELYAGPHFCSQPPPSSLPNLPLSSRLFHNLFNEMAILRDFNNLRRTVTQLRSSAFVLFASSFCDSCSWIPQLEKAQSTKVRITLNSLVAFLHPAYLYITGSGVTFFLLFSVQHIGVSFLWSLTYYILQ
jgi:hypothetical protein